MVHSHNGEICAYQRKSKNTSFYSLYICTNRAPLHGHFWTLKIVLTSNFWWNVMTIKSLQMEIFKFLFDCDFLIIINLYLIVSIFYNNLSFFLNIVEPLFVHNLLVHNMYKRVNRMGTISRIFLESSVVRYHIS